MDQNKIDMFVAFSGNKFPSDRIWLMRKQLEKVDDSKLMYIQSIEYKDPTTLLIVSILIGGFGIDRFMLGQIGIGVGKLLTCGGFGVWTIIDWFLIRDAAKEINYQKFSQVAY